MARPWLHMACSCYIMLGLAFSSMSTVLAVKYAAHTCGGCYPGQQCLVQSEPEPCQPVKCTLYSDVQYWRQSSHTGDSPRAYFAKAERCNSMLFACTRQRKSGGDGHPSQFYAACRIEHMGQPGSCPIIGPAGIVPVQVIDCGS